MFFHRLLLQSLAGWFVRGLSFDSPPTPPTNLGVNPYPTPKKPPLYATTGMDEGMFFLPLRWTERI
ncbi:MAG: hypothetical protein NTW61_00935, partial [Candidatus Melainabacteria bacterium]|nr:hypothetical protein [Candidatus Melainabacteria bacterium]